MKRFEGLLLPFCLGALALTTVLGCPVTTPNGGNGGIAGLCGTRNITSVPGPGVVRETVIVASSTVPKGSALGAVVGFFGFLGGDCEGGEVEPSVTEYEVGTGGAILSVDGEAPDGDRRFVVQSRCLFIERDEDLPENENDNEEDEDEDPIDDLIPEPGPCGEDEFPLGPNGLGDTGEGFICVAVNSNVCLECTRKNGDWVNEYSGSMTHRAKGSIDNVTAFDVCTGQPTQVSIQAGDEVTVTIEFGTTYAR